MEKETSKDLEILENMVRKYHNDSDLGRRVREFFIFKKLIYDKDSENQKLETSNDNRD
jgi:hypothetical protein